MSPSPCPRRRRLVLAAAAAAVLGLTASPVGAEPSAHDRGRAVVGADGYLFIAQDWTVACQDRGQARRVAAAAHDLVTGLQAGGRPAVVTVGPDTSTVLSRDVPAVTPTGACGREAREAVWPALTRTVGPAFLDLRPALARADRRTQTYWRKDTHWTPNAGVGYARALAARLDPVLASRLRTVPAVYHRDGDLAQVLQQPSAETVHGEQLVNPGVTVQELPYTFVGTDHLVRRTVAVGRPGARVVPGTTLFLGDSFDSTALEQLAPLFERTEFLYPGEQGSAIAPVAAQVALADRVVVEVVQRFVQRHRMFDADAVQAVRAVPPRAAG